MTRDGTDTPPRLVLASASPARRQQLAAAGIPAEAVVSGVDESAVTTDGAEDLCAALARRKADAVAQRLRTEQRGVLVLGCDSVLSFAGEVFGKPTDAADAVARWRRMRGHSGVLCTGHALVDVAGGRVAEAVGRTGVTFADVTDEEIDAYVATGEPLRVAGGFTLDGLGAPFVTRLDGDPGTVVGLSMPLLRRLLAELGVPLITLWQPPAD